MYPEVRSGLSWGRTDHGLGLGIGSFGVGSFGVGRVRAGLHRPWAEVGLIKGIGARQSVQTP